ncbi:MAG TPA: hypothetical protein VGR07_23190 [Thermoanaerobaculia bacterium]|jgi:uncharacterized membrane protein YphA (DoxX/SURF4 family)|nr:hypothetical protein [Thermoanaerobaculia bacterium]
MSPLPLQTEAEGKAQERAAAAGPARELPPAVRWTLPQRIALRFLVAYSALFLVTDRLIGFLPFSDFFTRKYAAFWLAVVTWVGRHLLHTRYEIYLLEGGEGISNTAYGSILFLCYMALAAVAAALWSVLDRQRDHYERLHQWLRLLLRASLALAMISYGILKALPTQMIAPPPLSVLLQRVGSLTPMRMLWIFIGSSPAYESFTGCAELLGGLLLLVPRTTLLGALLCAADMLMVVTLNFCYDVHVKLYSLHLLFMALVLLAPDLPRLADLFLFDRRVEPAVVPPLFVRPGRNRIPQLLLLLLGLYAIGTTWTETRARYRQFHPPRPPFYGAWSVEEFAVDGKEVPLFTDPERWRWVMFQQPRALTVELMIGARRGYSLALDRQDRRMKLGPPRPVAGAPPAVPGPPAEFSFTTPESDLLILEGRMAGHPTHAKLRRMPLLATGFHWIFDPPKEDR